MTESEYYNVAGNASALAANLAGTFATNSENKKLMREQMRFNEKMFDKQVDYNWQMYNATNEYNSPSAQYQRLLEANINPAIALGKQNMSEAQGGNVSPPSAPSAPTLNAPNFDSLSRIGDTIYNSEVRAKTLEKLQSEIDSQKIDNAYKREANAFNLAALNENVSELKWRNVDWGNRIRLWNATYSNMRDLSDLDVKLKRAQLSYEQQQSIAAELDVRLKQMHLDNLPAEFAAQMAVYAAQRYSLLASGAASYSQVTANLALAAKTNAEKYGIDLHNREADAISESLIKAATQENWSKYRKFRLDAQSDMDTFNYFYGDEQHRNTIGRAFSIGRSTGSGLSPIRIGM